MKKIIALTLVLILAVGLFAGCKSSDKGSVYFLNFKPEADSAWQALAKTYTEKTGVTVKVVTAASGTYETTLTAEMAKKDAPTLFQCGNETALDTWKDYCLALDGTKFLNEMTTSDFNIKGEDGKTYCAGYCYEAFGIIVNTELLEKAGHSLDEIKDFASLKTSPPARTSWALPPSPPPVWIPPLPGASPAIWPTCRCTMSSATTT